MFGTRYNKTYTIVVYLMSRNTVSEQYQTTALFTKYMQQRSLQSFITNKLNTNFFNRFLFFVRQVGWERFPVEQNQQQVDRNHHQQTKYGRQDGIGAKNKRPQFDGCVGLLFRAAVTKEHHVGQHGAIEHTYNTGQALTPVEGGTGGSGKDGEPEVAVGQIPAGLGEKQGVELFDVFRSVGWENFVDFAVTHVDREPVRAHEDVAENRQVLT